MPTEVCNVGIAEFPVGTGSRIQKLLLSALLEENRDPAGLAIFTANTEGNKNTAFHVRAQPGWGVPTVREMDIFSI